jgi:predicted component of type VI protein secretion system
MKATLLVVEGNTTKRRVALKLPCVLGRSREADMTVAHPLISRRHCELSEANGLLMLRDLASLNGTMIGGRQITSAPLLPDAEFSIGPLTFRVQYEYNGDLESLPPTCYVDAAADVEFADGGAAAPDAAANESCSAAAASLSDSQIVEVPDFVALADADPDEVAAEVLDAPEIADGQPPAAATYPWPPAAPDKRPTEPMPFMPFEPQEDDPALHSGGMQRESPWASEASDTGPPQVPAAKQEPPAPAPPPGPKPSSYSDDIDPEFGSFLEHLQ